MGRLTLAIAIAAIASSTAATAQPMGQGSGGASPVMMSCRGDLDTLCDGAMGMPGVQCLMDNISDVSDPCADALDQAMANMEQGHGQRGGGMDDGEMDDDAEDAMKQGKDKMKGKAKEKMKGGKDKD